ncbi:uncharacterized protein LOC103720280 [Phoenix dactylifera]|uniref:Uncharacterized protein LOC103720280 n=1 Tax=Phoenix dactylifera TaxID=42345 RepID=A0A8B9AU73_PHODC|nr:uncharacterized protein LOC103720280 [Phoenix dactylifera]
MKNLYPKGKGKIHPSPASPFASSGGGSSGDALAVLKLLPAAILALTVALGNEDKEVLAYLITRSINGPGMAASAGMGGGGGEERRRGRRVVGGVHRPLFDCGCFDCYTSFWSRWDCSPDRELIHHAIEAFEEHLANYESKGGGSGGRGRRRERRASDRSVKGKKSKEKEKEKEKKKAEETTEEMVLELPAVSFSCEEEPAEVGDDEKWEVEVEEEGGDETDVAAAGERRRGWPDVMGLFNSRLWSLWSPGD